MKRPSLLLLLLFVYLFSLGQSDQQKAVDKIFSEWDHDDVPGCAIGIFKDGKVDYARGFGMANLEYDIPNDAQSVFRIGSTSKQFTSACIVLLAQAGKLELDNSLDQYFPAFPEYAKTITIRHLLNHTSGVRDYLTLSSLKGMGDDDYYKDQDIMNWLIHQQDLNFQPGEEFMYSNSGYWLLGQIVGEVSGMNMAEFAKQEIFQPLGMDHTHFHNDHTQIVPHRASGYRPSQDEGFRISMTTLDMIGDGGIFTSIDDIKKWDDAFYASKVLNQDFWKTMTTNGNLNDGTEIDYAAGLFVDTYKGLKSIHHGGSFVGFRAELLRFPEQHFSVAVFANRADANPSRLAMQVADLYLQDHFVTEPVAETPSPPFTDEPVAPVIHRFSLEEIAGTYELQPGVDVTIEVEGDRLNVFQGWNSSTYFIEKTEENSFQIPDNDDIRFVFGKLDGLTGEALELIVFQGGGKSVATRKAEVDNSDVVLADYPGSFFSKELDETYTLSVEGDHLEVQVRNNPPLRLSPNGKDVFASPLGVFRFQRKGKQIAGFELDSGRVTNLKFEKR